MGTANATIQSIRPGGPRIGHFRLRETSAFDVGTLLLDGRIVGRGP